MVTTTSKTVIHAQIKIWINIFWDLLCKHYEDLPRKKGHSHEPAEMYFPFKEENIVTIDGRKMYRVFYNNGPAIIRWEEELKSTLSDAELEQIRQESSDTRPSSNSNSS